MVWDLRPDGGLQLAVILLLGGLTLYSWWKAVHPELPEDENEQNVA